MTETKAASFNLSFADLARARRDLAHRDSLRREGLLEDPPCIACGAPIGPDNKGHDDGCFYEDRWYVTSREACS